MGFINMNYYKMNREIKMFSLIITHEILFKSSDPSFQTIQFCHLCNLCKCGSSIKLIFNSGAKSHRDESDPNRATLN
jgi:hypothetical protein